MIFYSPSKNSFFDSSINVHIPTDKVEISRKEHTRLMDMQSTGMELFCNDGFPDIRSPIRTEDVLKTEEVNWRNEELKISDIELYKVQDSDRKAVATVSEWRDYRKQLRDWPEHANFPDREFRPISPRLKRSNL